MNILLWGNYIGSNTYILMKHNIDKCKYEWNIRPSSFLSGVRCPKCGKRGKGNEKTTDYFKQEVYKLVGDEYKVIGEYVLAKEKILMGHNCGHQWECRPNNFLQGSRCPKCAKKINLIRKHNMFLEKLYNIFGDEFTVLGKYTGYNKKILIKHEKCQYEYEATPEKILQGKKCPKCAGRV